jgi:hypothetical protein
MSRLVFAIPELSLLLCVNPVEDIRAWAVQFPEYLFDFGHSVTIHLNAVFVR